MNKNWTHDEVVVALNLYCKIPFKNSSARHPLVKEYAQLLGRTPAAVNLKIGNLGKFDPVLRDKGITGLSHASKIDEQVWNEFFGNSEKLAFESERIIARLKNESIEESTHIDINSLPAGEERIAVVRQRVNQQFFHTAVLASYGNRCCVSGVSEVGLLEACHISPWSQDVANRTNPRNGLCLNPFFHKAFDTKLFAITPDYEIRISERLIAGVERDEAKRYLAGLNGCTMLLPEKFLPDKDLLAVRYESYKNAQ